MVFDLVYDLSPVEFDNEAFLKMPYGVLVFIPTAADPRKDSRASTSVECRDSEGSNELAKTHVVLTTVLT